MELKLIHILGPVLAIVAMLFYGKALVARGNGRSINVVPTLVMIMGAILFRQFFGDGTMLDRICLTLMDFGIAMIIDSRYLAYHKEHPKVFWVPGVLALILSFIIYFAASLFGWTVNGLFDGESDITTGQILVELGPDDQIGELNYLIYDYDIEYKRAYPFISMDEDEDLAQYYLFRVPDGKTEEVLKALQQDHENVDAAELNSPIKLELPASNNNPRLFGVEQGFLANDPMIAQQWWLDVATTNRIHALLKQHPPKRKARVAILDTGVDNGHEDLSPVFRRSPGKGDQHGHGTHCAGLAGAATNNGIGMASLNWEGRFIDIMSYQALDARGSGDLFSLSRAISQAADDGVDVISLSLGSQRKEAPRPVREAIQYARRRGCIVIAAAGNNGGADASEHSPCNVPGVIAVAATDSEGRRASFSNVNARLKMPIAAPGKDIFSTMPNGQYRNMSGTSMATPLVSGLVGILRSYRPLLSAEEAWSILHRTGFAGPDASQIGRSIDPEAAIRHVLGK